MTTTSSMAVEAACATDAGERGVPRTSGRDARGSQLAISTDAGPLIRTTPMPAAPRRRRNRNDGIVGGEHATYARYFFAAMMTVFMNASPMLSDVTVGILGDREVHDAAFVGIERSHLLRHAARSRLLGHEARHLPQLRVLVPAKAVAVDDDPVVVAELLPERGGHDVLQRLQPFAAAADEDAAVLSFEIDARAVGRLFDPGSERQAHGVDHPSARNR